MKIAGGGLALSGVDVEFNVQVDGHILGTLKVSKGSLDWRPRNGRHRNSYTISWRDFDYLVQGAADENDRGNPA
jgi:hypothetical protein